MRKERERIGVEDVRKERERVRVEVVMRRENGC